ncbi:MAG: hypothetical protein GY755_15305 [Chloroflexi bacterium]|nr:hypothetical protein [Chloroflexota bacterium]
MMAFSNTYTAVTGGTLSAAQWNTGVRDNLTALWTYTTAGDIEYATSSSTLARLGIGAAGQVMLTNSGATAPEWASGLVSTDSLTDTNSYSYSTTTERDVPNSSKSVTVATTSTIIVVGSLVGYCAVAGKHGSFWVNVDGSNYAVEAKVGASVLTTASLLGIFTGVSSGSITVKLREKPGFGGNAVSVDRFSYTVLVIPE